MNSPTTTLTCNGTCSCPDCIVRRRQRCNGHDIVFDATRRELMVRGRPAQDVKRCVRKMGILLLLMSSPDEWVSREDIYTLVWPQPYDRRFHNNDVYVAIHKLRKHLEPFGCIENDDNGHYRFNSDACTWRLC